MASSHYPIPATPRVISPSPTPTEASSREGYFGPITRSLSRHTYVTSPQSVGDDAEGSGSDPEKRARPRSKSPRLESRKPKIAPLTTLDSTTASSAQPSNPVKRKPEPLANGDASGHLSIPKLSHDYWRELSRSPSPLGLIPIHTQFRSFIHRHEIPRKVLHVSIGFVAIYFYAKGYQPTDIHPYLLASLIPLASLDAIRHHFQCVNKLYIRVVGALMRESEVDGWNGVIWYLLGSWIVLTWLPKDIGVLSVLLLSWCDTAASTFGRLWGRYTPRIRRGKSLAGSLAALVVGVATAVLFWGAIAPHWGASKGYDTGKYSFMFQNRLTLPSQIRGLLGWTAEQATITGGLALGAMSVVSGFIASASEAIDLFGWDDNLTIPVLCGVGIWGFLRVFT